MTRVTQINGLPVIDAKRGLMVTVKRGDIIRARDTQAPDCCAMARACLRELQCHEVRVYISRAYVRTNEHNWVRYYVPPRLRRQILAMADGQGFAPGEFTLHPPPPSHRLGYRPRRGGTATGRGNKRKAYVLTHVRARATTT